MKCHHQLINLTTEAGIHITDITQQLCQIITDCHISSGIITVSSLHTTMAITVNEAEQRLLIDIDNYFSKLVPEGQGYLHDDLHLRDVPEDEPENAHSHLISMIFGNSESFAVNDGKPTLGTYQSVMAIELDGPRKRQISVQIVGQ